MWSPVIRRPAWLSANAVASVLRTNWEVGRQPQTLGAAIFVLAPVNQSGVTPRSPPCAMRRLTVLSEYVLYNLGKPAKFEDVDILVIRNS